MGTDSGTYGPGKLVERLPTMQGAVVGAVAHIAGLLVTYVVLVVDGEFEFGGSGVAGVGTVDELGWLFFGAHFARVERSTSFDIGGNTERVNIITERTFEFPEAVLYVVPVALLIGAGVVLVAEVELWEGSLKAHAATGATVVVGYFPLAALGMFVFESQVGVGDGAFVQSPELSSTVFVAGLAYPVCFGAVGGVLSWLLPGFGDDGDG